jgi:ribosomal protein L14E/L6E/L27E
MNNIYMNNMNIDKNIICHIISFNPITNEKIFNINNDNLEIINLDIINKKIINDEKMTNYFKKYETLKESKNSNFKQVEKKMNDYWEETFYKMIDDSISNKKRTILLGQIHHYKSKKKLKLNIPNKILINDDIKNTVQNIIKNNLENHSNDIISGVYNLNNIDYNYLKKKITDLIDFYRKDYYDFKSLEDTLKMINYIDNNKNKLWISMKQEYNEDTFIHPSKGKIYAYIDPIWAVLSSINFDDEIEKTFSDKVKIKINDSDIAFDKMKVKRYVYLVDKRDFLPYEKGKKMKYYSQNQVKILEKEKIDNVYSKFKELKII